MSLNKLSTFHCFPDLPTELRNKIWKYALPSPRIIQVGVLEKYPDEMLYHPDLWPKLLYACSASRQIVLSCMKPLLQHNNANQTRSGAYINPAHDILYLDYKDVPKLVISFPNIEKIQIAIMLPSVLPRDIFYSEITSLFTVIECKDVHFIFKPTIDERISQINNPRNVKFFKVGDQDGWNQSLKMRLPENLRKFCSVRWMQVKVVLEEEGN